MNKCIICGSDSGFEMICESCKAAWQHYKNAYVNVFDLKEGDACNKITSRTTETDSHLINDFLSELESDPVLAIYSHDHDEIKKFVEQIKQALNEDQHDKKQDNQIQSLDRGKTINALKACISDPDKCGYNCPYHSEKHCYKKLLTDVICLLENQDRCLYQRNGGD